MFDLYSYFLFKYCQRIEKLSLLYNVNWKLYISYNFANFSSFSAIHKSLLTSQLISQVLGHKSGPLFAMI